MLTLEGDVSTLTDEPILASSVTPAGVVSFRLSGSGITWTFTGNLDGDEIAGRHTLTDGSTTASGDWTAER